MEFLFLRVCFCVCVRVCVFLVWFSTLFGSEWFHSTTVQRKQMHFLSCAPATWKHIPVFGTGLLLP